MTLAFDPKEVASRLELPSGEVVVLLDRLGKGDRYSKEDQARNVFRIDGFGGVLWQIRSAFDSEGSPFTRLHMDQGKLTAYRWDGGSYAVAIDTGVATPLVLER